MQRTITVGDRKSEGYTYGLIKQRLSDVPLPLHSIGVRTS